MKSSDVYREALARAQQHPQVQAALGTPVEDGWWMAGQINIQNDTGNANITIPSRSERQREDSRRGDEGRRPLAVLELDVQIEGRQTINLLPVSRSTRPFDSRIER